MKGAFDHSVFTCRNLVYRVENECYKGISTCSTVIRQTQIKAVSNVSSLLHFVHGCNYSNDFRNQLAQTRDNNAKSSISSLKCGWLILYIVCLTRWHAHKRRKHKKLSLRTYTFTPTV